MARPVAFEEMMLKLASSVTVRSQLSQVRRGAGAFQYGVYHSGAAPQVGWEVSAAMAANPEHLSLALDIRNGFGAVQRKSACQGAQQHCPTILGLFNNLWGNGVTPTVWIETEAGWKSTSVHDGLLQGACEAPVAFALALRVALEDFWDRKSKHPELKDIPLQLWAYVDDLKLRLNPAIAPDILRLLKATLKEHGLSLRADKCSAYLPQPQTQEQREDLAKTLEGLAELRSQGLPLLGSVSDGAFHTEIGPQGTPTALPARKRATAAIELVRRTAVLAQSGIPERTLGPAWKILSIVANNALTFDSSVLPPSALAPHAAALDQAVGRAACLLAGMPTETPSWNSGSLTALAQCSPQGAGEDATCKQPAKSPRSRI